MRRWLVLLLFTPLAFSQTPQTARQALLELINTPTPPVVDKHTPNVLLAEMAKLPPDVRQKQQQGLMFLSMAMAMSHAAMQTFDAGPVLLKIDDPKSQTKVEVTVERDDLVGDSDDMEFGFNITTAGKPQEYPGIFRLLVNMKLEDGTWKLARVGVSAGVQLDDPKTAAMLVKAIQEQAKKAAAAAANTQPGMTMMVTPPAQARDESRVIGQMRILLTGETAYAGMYPNVGFTCTIADLGGSLNGTAADEHGAQLIDPALAGGRRYGYRYEISGCSGTPARAYRILATPLQKAVGNFAYCTDQTAIMRKIDAANADACWTKGTPTTGASMQRKQP